jgi:hypothetical protein
MAATEAQTAWIRSVLGVDLARKDDGVADEAPRRIWNNVQAIWARASEQADAQMAALQDVLRASDDEDYQAIAAMGVNGVTGGHKVKLMAALMEIDEAAPDAGRLSAARNAAIAFIEHLGSDPRVDAMDTNDLSVPVSLAATLIPALEELDGALAALGRGR